RPFRELNFLRIRILPVAELSGLGAANTDGGRIYGAIHRAASQIVEIRQDHQSTHSPLKREVKELTLLVRSQEILLQTLMYGRSSSRKRRLQSVPEEQLGSSSPSSTPPDSTTVSEKARGHPSSSSTDAVASSAAAYCAAADSPSRPKRSEPAPPAPTTAAHLLSGPASRPETAGSRSSSTQFQSQFHLSLPSDTASTVSDNSMGGYSPRTAYSAAESTPPPTTIGRFAHGLPAPPAGIQDVASQLLNMLQTLQAVGDSSQLRLTPQLPQQLFIPQQLLLPQQWQLQQLQQQQ
ncbi:unnamed protein product, partial [Polarella glacialis]